MTRCFLKRKLREQERELMNGRQAARAAARRIEENERVMALNKREGDRICAVIEPKEGD